MKFGLLSTLSALALLSAASAEDAPRLRKPVLATERHGSASSHAAADSKGLPNFFPTELTDEQTASFLTKNRNGRNRNGNNGNENKKPASRKRQENRDRKRQRTDKDRSQEAANRERNRKSRQAENRGNDKVDPYHDNGKKGRNNRSEADNWARSREAKRIAQCERDGTSCNYSTPDGQCYDDCLDFDKSNGGACAKKCRFIEINCYEDCRDENNSISFCLDDCFNGSSQDDNNDRRGGSCEDKFCGNIDNGDRRADCMFINCSVNRSNREQKCLGKCFKRNNCDSITNNNDCVDCIDDCIDAQE